MGGLARRMPVTTITFAVAVLAIAGIFPLSGFWSKDEILEAVRVSGHTVLYIAALGTVFLTATYMSRLFFVAFTGAPRTPLAAATTAAVAAGEPPAAAGGHSAHESPAVMTIPMIVLAVLAAGLGLVGLPWRGGDIHSFLDPSGMRPVLETGFALLSSALAVAGIMLSLFLFVLRRPSPGPARRRPGFPYLVLANKFYIDELYALLIRGVLYSFTAAIAWFDRHVVDGMVNLVGGTSKWAGALLRKTVAGKVQLYALVVAGGLCAALVLLAFQLGLFGLGAGR